jgi:predicted RNA-binding protein associated with RNAse of E/G family
MLHRPGERWSTWVTWSADWEFLGWYVNLQSLLCRTAIGFDVDDHRLDILVSPDRSWRWKDDDELARSIEIGEYTEEEVASIWRDGEAAVAALERDAPPFCDPWPDWRPPPEWDVPTVLPAWDDGAAVLER